jgi:hypothetical protein
MIVAQASLLRRAARLLTPASLRTTIAGPRLQTLIEAVAQRRRETILTVSPVPRQLQPGTHAALDFELDGVGYVVSATVDQLLDRGASLTVKRGPEVRPPRGARVSPPAGRMVALFVPDGAGLGLCCQPILDISLRALRLQSSYPFDRGTRLRRLTIILNNEIVRVAEGSVIACSEMIDPFGRHSFECSVRLRAPTERDPDDDPAEQFEISEPTRVRGILWALCDLSHPVTLRVGHQLLRGRLEPIKGARDTLPAMRCTLERADAAPAVGAVQLECALYGSGYRFYARLTGMVGHVLMLHPAPVVREWHRRDEERLVLAEGAATFEFVHPVTRAKSRRAVEDASAHGVGFRREPDDDTIWPGLPLDEARLILPGVMVRPAEATVRTLSAHRCGVELGQMSELQSDRLRVELARVAAKPIELSDGGNLDEIVRFHQSVHLLENEMGRNLDATRDATRVQWQTAHQHPDGLMRTAFVRWKGGVGATLTLVRAYEATWVLQHSAVASPAVPANPGMLHSLLVRLAIPRPDGEYVCGYIDEDARSQHAVMGAFFDEWSTPEHRGATRFVLWTAESRRRLVVPKGVRRLKRSEELLVEHAASRVLDPICARALGLRPGEIGMPATRAAYAKVGLVRAREAWGSFAGGRPRAILMRELASPGLSLSSMLSAGVLIPVAARDLEADVHALCDVLLSQPLPGSPPCRFLLVPESVDEALLGAAGMKRVAGCTLYAMHRYGLQEYHRYVASRYGFLHGRLRARTTEAA